MTTTGQIVYTDRAFAQDGELAIRNDLMRALVELVTNADDAYLSSAGKIIVKINKGSGGVIDVSVHDQAKGLSRDGLIKHFTTIGGVNDQFLDGNDVRGLLGRGAKDVASLGSITFASIKDGLYSELTLMRSGEYSVSDATQADPEMRKALLLSDDQNGLTATIHIDPNIIRNVLKMPALQEKLATHVQLRDILKRHEVVLIDARNGTQTATVSPRIESTELLLERQIEVAGYPGPVLVRIEQLKPAGSGSVTEYSRHGIAIKSGVTTYQNLLFGRETHPEAGSITGSVVVPQINELIRAYDRDNRSVEGGRLVSRDRDGLVREHPFTRALTKSMLQILDPILESLRAQRASHIGQGDELTKALDDAARAIRGEINTILSEIEDQPPSGQQGDLYAIPSSLKMYPDTTSTITIRSKSDAHVAISSEVAMSRPVDVVSATSPRSAAWVQHERLEIFQSKVHVHSGSDLGAAVVKITVGNEIIDVPVSVVEKLERSQVIPTSLEFTVPRATIAPTRTRKLELIAPLEDANREVAIEIAGADVAIYPATVELKVSPSNDYCIALVPITASRATGILDVTAKLAPYLDAQCKLVIDEAGPLGGIDLDFKLENGSGSKERVNTFNQGGNILIRVQADHKAFDNVFGDYDSETGKYLNEDSIEARTMLSESISRALAEMLVVRQSLVHPEEFQDGEKYIIRIHELTNRFLVKFNAALR